MIPLPQIRPPHLAQMQRLEIGAGEEVRRLL